MYVTLRTEDKILSSKIVKNTESKYHSAFLISTITNTLLENGLKPEDLDVIGINVGTGSFTGIRACTTVARVMAQQLNIKAIGVSSLEILSRILSPELLNSQSSLSNSTLSQRKRAYNPLVALDARKNKAYLWCDGEVKGAIELEKVQDIINKGGYDVITDDRLKKILGGRSYQSEDYPLGDILSELVLEKLPTSKGNWAEVMPLYIQPPPMG